MAIHFSRCSKIKANFHVSMENAGILSSVIIRTHSHKGNKIMLQLSFHPSVLILSPIHLCPNFANFSDRNIMLCYDNPGKRMIATSRLNAKMKLKLLKWFKSFNPVYEFNRESRDRNHHFARM